MIDHSLKSERVLITGSGGVVGTALVKELAKNGFTNFTALRRSDCDLLDMASTQAIWKEVKPTIVFHLAGWVAGVQGNLNNAGRAFYENTQINLNVIEASRLIGAPKIIAAGTTATYSDEVSIPMKEIDIWKSAPHGSEEAYGHSKRGMLAQLEAYNKQYGLDFAYMICTNLYGENDRFDEKFGHVIPSLISRFDRSVEQHADSITIWGDGSPTRDFVYAGDAARAFIMAAQSGQGCYNLATGISITIKDLVSELTRVFAYTGTVLWDTSKPSGQKKRSYDVTRINQLGWTPEVTLEEGLKRTADWFSAHRDTLRR